jgi:predicted O-methyltransferase YrrM
MSADLKSAIKARFPRLRAHYSLIHDKRSFLHSSGWLRSKSIGHPCRPDGSPLPWMNYSVIRLLEERLRGDMSMFEFGSGYSTQFYADRVEKVTAVEHDATWYQIAKHHLPQNVELILQPVDTDGLYCRTITRAALSYDVVVVDGIDRVNCVHQALPFLTERGVLLLDDSEREQYNDARNEARAAGFRSLNFEGLKPNGSELSRTTVFYRNENCFGI